MFNKNTGFTKIAGSKPRGETIKDFKPLMVEYKVNYFYRFETIVWVNHDFPPDNDDAYLSFKLCMN